MGAETEQDEPVIGAAPEKEELPAEGQSLIRQESPGEFVIKPLNELYGSGTGLASLDAKSPIFLPLLRAIEEPIVLYYRQTPGLTDAAVLLIVKALGATPEAHITDPLAERIQQMLAMTLSVNNYSRQEVRQALRYVGRSVERHTSLAGPRGYLTFINDFV